MSNARYLAQKLAPFVGATFIGTTIDKKDDYDGEDYLGLAFFMPDSSEVIVLWVMRGEEGNGPGWLDISEVDKEN